MRGTITYVNIGDYFSNVPSIINNVGITQIGDMGWDIGRDSIGTYDAGPQLPKGLKVQLDFTPIHDFVPQYGEAFIATRSILGIPDPVIADPIITDFPLTDPIIL
jgi:hypothetical protein